MRLLTRLSVSEANADGMIDDRTINGVESIGSLALSCCPEKTAWGDTGTTEGSLRGKGRGRSEGLRKMPEIEGRRVRKLAPRLRMSLSGIMV